MCRFHEALDHKGFANRQTSSFFCFWPLPFRVSIKLLTQDWTNPVRRYDFMTRVLMPHEKTHVTRANKLSHYLHPDCGQAGVGMQNIYYPA